MGFHIEINSIIRSDAQFDLRRGADNDFTKTGSRVFFDDIPIWLTQSDWTAIAEIQVLTQIRAGGAVSGTFKVLHVYSEAEQAPITRMFRRMYASGGDPYIYMLRSKADYDAALTAGVLTDPSLQSDGFIHASPPDQLTRLANKYYADVGPVVVLVIEANAVDTDIEWEPASDGVLYPHIYGPLNMNAVAWTVPAIPDAAGVFDIEPESLGEDHAI